MGFLDPGDPEPAPGAQVTRTEAIVISLGVHLALLLMLLFLPAVLPDSLRDFFLGVPAPPPAAATSVPPLEVPEPPPASTAEIPLRFAYVKLPDDQPSAENPDARLLSDRNRRARQEVPTPPDITRFTLDPHSEGDSINREIPDPTLPEGSDDPDRTEKPPRVAAAGGGDEGTPDEEPPAAPDLSAGEGTGEQPEDAGAGIERPEGEGPAPTKTEVASRAGGGEAPGETGGGGPKAGNERESPEGIAYEPSDALRESISDMKVGERKFVFRNPGYLRGSNPQGTLSFDTQDFPWGDYARKIYLIIRENWYARIPLAAREGIRGFGCHRFVIERNGRIASIRTVRPSSVPPFNRAAQDALRASDPLPPLPAAFPGQSEGVTFCFYYNMYPGEAE